MGSQRPEVMLATDPVSTRLGIRFEISLTCNQPSTNFKFLLKAAKLPVTFYCSGDFLTDCLVPPSQDGGREGETPPASAT
jgi:hypothetical protein